VRFWSLASEATEATEGRKTRCADERRTTPDDEAALRVFIACNRREPVVDLQVARD